MRIQSDSLTQSRAYGNVTIPTCVLWSIVIRLHSHSSSKCVMWSHLTCTLTVCSLLFLNFNCTSTNQTTCLSSFDWSNMHIIPDRLSIDRCCPGACSLLDHCMSYQLLVALLPAVCCLLWHVCLGLGEVRQ